MQFLLALLRLEKKSSAILVQWRDILGRIKETRSVYCNSSKIQAIRRRRKDGILVFFVQRKRIQRKNPCFFDDKSKTDLGFEIGRAQRKCQRRPTLQSLANPVVYQTQIIVSWFQLMIAAHYPHLYSKYVKLLLRKLMVKAQHLGSLDNNKCKPLPAEQTYILSFYL